MAHSNKRVPHPHFYFAELRRRKQGRFGKEDAKAWDSKDTDIKTARGAKKEKRPAKVVTF
eukprot:1160018-Pelagomonas_calceolata.AAC.9